MSNTPSRQNSSNRKPSALVTEKDNSGQHKITDNSHISSTLMNLPDAKCIQIYLNGDEHFSGCRCVINNRYYRNLDMFLSYLTERLKPSFGAVRNIYTPINGHPVLRLEDLNSKHKYVVGGNERFKKIDLGYTDVVDKKPKRNDKKTKNTFKISKAKPLCHRTLNILLHQNGNFKEKPNRVSLLPQDLECWELTFKKIVEVIKCGPVKRLCSLSGKPILTIEELVHNQSYVFIGKHEVFKLGQYGTFMQHSSSSSKGKHIAQHRTSKKSSSVITSRSSGVYSQISVQSSRIPREYSSKKNDQDQHQDSFQNNLNISGLGNGAESDSFNPCDFPGNIKSKIKINFDDDLSGIFRSKNQNHLTAGAVEIEDSPETIVDVPVDLLEAEEVEDEITPDMERSLQHLSLDVPEEIVAFLPTMQNKPNSNETQVSGTKYNLNQSQTIDIHNIFV